MELDDMKLAWQRLDERVARIEAVVPATGLGGIRRELRPLVVGQWIQAALGLILALAAGSFWFDHRGVTTFVVTGLLLHGYGIAMIVAAARNLTLAARARASAPVLELQQRVADLRAWRIREGRWFGIAGCFMWVAMVVWAFGLLGVDIVALRPAFVAFLLLTAIVCLMVYLWVARLDRAPEGSAVHRAHERLADLERFKAG